MKRLLLGIVLVLVLTGCDTFEDMSEIFEKQGIAQDAIKEKTGWESQVGFNINNGVLTNVSVILNANDVRSKTVSELEEVVQSVVSETFKSKPKTVYIQVAIINES